MVMFSIIVPVYNVEKYLDRCINSLINQTYENIEIILVNDGSTDNSLNICQAYQNLDERICIINKENGGLSSARNSGLQAATGKYIVFVDSDDYIQVTTCKLFYDNYLCLSDYDILIGDVTDDNPTLSHIHPDEFNSGEDYLLTSLKQQKCPMAVWLNVYRNEFLKSNNLLFKEGILHEDEQFSPRAFLKAKRLVITGYRFYHYVIRGDSITQNSDKRPNMLDFYETALELEQVYNTLRNDILKRYLLDSLTIKYLSLFYSGRLEKYGANYVHKKFVYRNCYRFTTKSKALLFLVSPSLYCNINGFIKSLKSR